MALFCVQYSCTDIIKLPSEFETETDRKTNRGSFVSHSQHDMFLDCGHINALIFNPILATKKEIQRKTGTGMRKNIFITNYIRMNTYV